MGAYSAFPCVWMRLLAGRTHGTGGPVACEWTSKRGSQAGRLLVGERG